MWFTTNGMCAKNNNIYSWREQAIIEWSRWSDLGEWPLTVLVDLVNSWLYALTVTTRVISSGEVYCCLLPRCEALLTCRSGFPIATLLISAVLIVRSTSLLKLISSHFRKYCEDNFICDRLRKSCTTVEQKHDDVIEWISWKLPPPKWRAVCAPVVDCEVFRVLLGLLPPWPSPEDKQPWK